MADTTFAPGTVIKADWLQDVNDAVYNGTLPEGGGDLTGPASSTTGHIAMFSDSTGKVLADTGISIPSGYIFPGDELVTADAHQTLTWKILGAQCGYQGSRIHPDYGGVPDPTTAYEGQVLTRVSGQAAWSTPAGAGLGDVSGPASATTNRVAAFDGTTGKLLKDSGILSTALATLTGTETLTNKTIGSGSSYAGTRIPVAYGGVPDPTSATDGEVLMRVSGTPEWASVSGSGLGDVVGPASANNNELVVFDGTTGKTIKQGGILIDDIVSVSGTQVIANKTFTSCVWANVIQETNGGTGINAYTTGDIIYSPSTNNLITLPVGSEGEVLTVTSGLPSWEPIAGSGLGDVVGPASATNNAIVTFDGTTGKLVRDSTKLLPAGTIVGTSDVQTLTSKTMSTGCVWNGTDIAIADGGTGASTAQTAINNLTNVAAATAGHVLTKVGTNAVWNALSSTTWPYYADQSAVGSNITYYSGQTGVAVYPHNDYQSVIRVIRGASDYTGTPTTYSHLGQLNGHTVAYQTYAGYQQYLNTDGGGRTMSNAYHARVEHNTYGDTNGFFTTVSNNGHGNMAGISGNWTGQPSVTCFGGEAYANAAKTNLYAMEVHLNSNGQANVTGIGTVIGLNRDNTTAIYNHAWIGHRVQSEGTQFADIGFQASGNLKFGLDLTGIAWDSNKAGIIMPTGSRIYMGAAATTWPTIVPTASGAYLETDNTRIKSSVGLAGTGFLEILSPTTSSSATAGVASPLPANPFTYITIKLDGVSYKIPAYSA